MRFDILTIFPEAFENYFNVSIIKRAKAKGLIKINVFNLRKWAVGKRQTVDDRPYGGGAGMVIKAEPLIKAVTALKSKIPAKGRSASGGKNQKSKIILFSPAGKQFDNKMAAHLAKKYNHLILICGHYEGIDARVEKVIQNSKLKIENLSLGPYVLTGGEIPAMALIDSVSRQIKGVLGRAESLEEKRLGIGVPVYTRPEIFVYRGRKYKVPKILLSGNHQKIEEWRKKHRQKY